MSDTIQYNSEELYETSSIVDEAKKILTDDIKTSINSDFNELASLDLFTDGLSKLTKQTDRLIAAHENLVASLKEHDNSITNTEKESVNLIKEYKGGSGNNNQSGYSGGNVAASDATTNDVVKGTEINEATLQEIIPQLDYSSHLQILKNILIYNEGNLSEILLDTSLSNHCVYLLKKMMTNDEASKPKEATLDTKNVQKVLLNSIANDEKNAFAEAELDELSILVGIKHFNNVAKSKNMTVGDFMLEEKNEQDFFEEIKKVYSNDNITDMNKNELDKFKKCIDTLAGKNNMTSEELLSNKDNMSIIRKGVVD